MTNLWVLFKYTLALVVKRHTKKEVVCVLGTDP